MKIPPAIIQGRAAEQVVVAFNNIGNLAAVLEKGIQVPDPSARPDVNGIVPNIHVSAAELHAALGEEFVAKMRPVLEAYAKVMPPPSGDGPHQPKAKRRRSA